MTLSGLITALVTPLTESGKIDLASLEKILLKQKDASVDGVAILGTTGEACTLSKDDRQTVIKKTVDILKGHVTIMAGASSPSTMTTLQLVQESEDLGVDAHLIATPYYNKPTQEGIFLHFEAVSNVVSKPVCIYNIASRCGQNIETTTMKRLQDMPHMAAVKESSGNMQQVQDVIEEIVHKNPNFTLLSGDDALALPHIALGAKGVVSVIANLLPKTMKKLITHAQVDDFAIARALHYALKPIIAACFLETNPICIKWLMAECKYLLPHYNLPLCAPLSATQKKLSEVLDISKHLLEDEL